MILNEIRPPKGATQKKKRLGRGESSGLGKTSGKGHKGQKARAGGFHKTGFEGGQMPLQRRLPKRGFHNFTRKEFATVNVGDLAVFAANSTVDFVALKEKGLVKKALDGLKILGTGELKIALTIKADRCSESAKKKIESAGGSLIINQKTNS